MTLETVFGHLAVRFSAHPENLATEALCFVLTKSSAAANAFITLARSFGSDVPSTLTYETQQVASNGALPDMNCFDEAGNVRIIVENKFWAGLTENQPVEYLKQLPAQLPALLLFIVPAARRAAVWGEIAGRCASASINLQRDGDGDVWVARTSEHRRLAIASWPQVLSALEIATSQNGDTASLQNVIQLRGLCETMDSEAFLPLTAHELSNGEFPRRIMDFADLPFAIIDEAVNQNICDVKGQREVPSRYGSGKYVNLGGFSPWLSFDASAWRRFGTSPLWLEFYKDYDNLGVLRERLKSLRACTPPLCFDSDEFVGVALITPSGVDRDVLIRRVVEQIRNVRELLVSGKQSKATSA